MWNEQHDSILQKEFGFYFSLDNAPYPNVWIKSATVISRDALPRKTSPISDRVENHVECVICSRASWTICRFLPSE